MSNVFNKLYTDMDSDEKKAFVSHLKNLNTLYRAGKSLVSDEEYDRLVEQLPKDHIYRNAVEPENVEYKGRIKHSIPMLSMQKAKTNPEMQKWIDSIVKASKRIEFCDCIRIKCSAKLDGIAGKRDRDKLVTRGDGQYGNDVSNAWKKGLLLIGANIEYQELGEFVVKLDYFEKNLSQKFSHPRNFVSGAIMSGSGIYKLDEEPLVTSEMTDMAFKKDAVVFQSYSLLPSISCDLSEFMKDFRKIECWVSSSVNYKIDGVIFEVLNKDIKDIMGCTEHHPNWAIALKPKDKTYESTIIDIVWQTGRTGKVTPVVIIQPVMIDGVEVQRATAHNAKNVIEMGLDIGKRIELVRSGSVIPYIVGVID